MHFSTRIILPLIAGLLMALVPLPVQGQEVSTAYRKPSRPIGITLDGAFADWTDKPYLSDRTRDESAENDLVTVRWYPDRTNGNLYLYAERLGANKHQDWTFTVSLRGDKGSITLVVDYKVTSGQVNVRAYDLSFRQLWAAKGKWGDEKESGKRVEFYVPLTYLTDTTVGGYEIKMAVYSGIDRVPDHGFILISTASTFPLITAAILAILVFAYGVIMLKRKTQ